MTGSAGPADQAADEAALAREFEAQRPRLLRLAYATTGSPAGQTPGGSRRST